MEECIIIIDGVQYTALISKNRNTVMIYDESPDSEDSVYMGCYRYNEENNEVIQDFIMSNTQHVLGKLIKKDNK